MTAIRVLSTLAVKGAFAELGKRFHVATGIGVDADFAPTLALLDRLRRGEAADVVILTREGLSEMLGEHRVAAASYVDVAKSWVGSGPNQQISPSALSQVLSPDQIKMISDMTGMSPDELMRQLSQQLPDVINHMTPDGRLPTEHEASRMI